MRMDLRIASAAILAVAACGVSAQEIPNYRVSIVSPASEAAVFNDNGDVWVRATVAPGLAKGDQIELLVDGEPAGSPATRLEFRLSGIVPGPHLLQARIIDSTGNVGSISPSSFFYVWQTSPFLFAQSEK